MIRLASNADLEAVVELEALLFTDNSMTLPRLEREARAGLLFVVGEPVHAYALVGNDRGLLDLLRLGVHPKQQKKGIGADLLVKAIGLGRDVVLTVQKSNAHALKLYRRFGFEITGHLPTADAWVLIRTAGRTACPTPP